MTNRGGAAVDGQWLFPSFRLRENAGNGTHATIAEIAPAEKINEPFIGRVLRRSARTGNRLGDLGGRQPAQIAL